MNLYLNMRPHVISCGAAVLAAMMASQIATTARASTINLTVTGVIGSGSDLLDQFGGGDLSNDTYVTNYVFDNTHGKLSSQQGGQTLTGDSSAGGSDPLVSAAITIYHGKTKLGLLKVTPQAQYVSQLATYLSPTREFYVQAFDRGSKASIMLGNEMVSNSTPALLTSSVSFAGTPGGDGESILEEFAGSSLTEKLYLDPTHATFNPSTRSNSAFVAAFQAPETPTASAAPEPGAWALMLAAIGAVGLALRRGKRRVGRAPDIALLAPR